MAIKSRALSLALRHGLPALVLVYVLLILLVPLSDPDLFWHLATGKRIVETGELPGREDPFAYTSPRVLSEGQVEGLRSQWLGQVVFYSVYALGGYPGLIIFRNILIVLPFVVLYVISVRKGLGPAWAVSVLALPLLLITFSLYYAFERPQAFTVLLSFTLVPLLYRLRRREGRRPWVVLLAIMMALWSNLHGGFIFGDVMVAAFAFGVLVDAAVRRKKEDLSVVIPAAIGIGASLLNPNGAGLLYGFLRGHIARLVSGPPTEAPGTVDMVGQLLEYKPLWYFYTDWKLVWPPFMVAFIALAILLVIVRYAARRKPDAPEAFVVVLIALFSLYYARGVTLALAVLPLFAACAAADLGRLWRAASGAVAALLCAALVMVTLEKTPWQLEPRARPARRVDSFYPEGAVMFIKSSGLKGPMFNELTWGGYLIWRLYPEHRVFIDGRLVSNQVYEAYTRVMKAAPGSVKGLEAFGVDFMLVPTISRSTGVITPLVLQFIEEEPAGWRLVFVERDAALLVRNSPSNSALIERHGLPFSFLNASIYSEADAILARAPGHRNALLSMAIALTGLGRYSDAEPILKSLPPSPVRDRYLARARQDTGRRIKSE